MKGPPVSTGGPSGAYSEVGVAFWRNQRSRGTGNDVALMGAGDDTFVWNPGDGSDTVEGQAGFDTLFNGANIAEQIDISANGDRFTRDVAGITMDLNDVEHIALRRSAARTPSMCTIRRSRLTSASPAATVQPIRS